MIEEDKEYYNDQDYYYRYYLRLIKSMFGNI